MSTKKKKRVKRGHPVGILIGFDEEIVVFWRIFSEIVRKNTVIKRGRKRKNQDIKQLYHFNEEIVNKLRPFIKEGEKSVLLVSPAKKEYSKEFLNHVSKHHTWLLKKGPNMISLSELEGTAKTIEDVTNLVSKEEFNESVNETSNREVMMILDELDKSISVPGKDTKILYTIKEIEKEIIKKKWKFNEEKPNYIILTDEYLDNPVKKNRLHRILQIAKNHDIKTKIISAETEAGKKVTGFGGLICFTR
jgi:stalled ribosome rescue protein Dom34